MKRNTLITSLIMLIVGIIGRIYASNTTYVDEAGVLHDSAWLPIGTLLIMISLVILLILGARYIISHFKNR